jgi:hypothetical protein
MPPLPGPSTSHAFTLTGLSAGTHYVAVQSRDAAGNVSRDDNNGNYYRMTVPPSAPSAFEAVTDTEICERTDAINTLIEEGETGAAIEQTSELIRHVASNEAAVAGEKNNTPATTPKNTLSALRSMDCLLDDCCPPHCHGSGERRSYIFIPAGTRSNAELTINSD